MFAKLVAISGPAQGTTFPLVGDETALGREPANEVCIADPLLSRRHCRITQNNQTFTLQDLDSRNGTLLNGVPIKQRRLAHQDAIKLGDSLLVFLSQAELEAATSPLSAVQFDDDLLEAGPTLALDYDDSLYLSAGKMCVAAQQARQLAEDFQALLRLGREVNTIRDLPTLSRRLLELTAALVPAERGAILLTDAGGEINSTFSWQRSAQAQMIISRTLIERALKDGVALLSRAANAEFQAAASLRVSDVQAVIAAPLLISAQVFGVLYLDTSEASGFADDHLQLAAAIAGLASAALDNARSLAQVSAETRRLQAELEGQRELIGESAAMQAVREFIVKVAPAHSTVLIRGESGVGKELIARAIHRHSPRAQQPFIAINCAALPAELIESELFGHEKGAFTGAIARKIGKLEAAQGGTVFLDEIGELLPAVQVKLLRVLQEREFERVGATRPIKLDVRLLAATNRDLEAAIKDGTFRTDLFYRLNVVSLTAPALRERREDIPLLAGYFVTKYAPQARRPVKGLSPVARDCLQRYEWPGNVRELENAIQHALVLGATEFILPDDLPDRVLEAAPPMLTRAALPPITGQLETGPQAAALTVNFHEAVNEAKKQIIIQAIAQAHGNYRLAAQQLGIHLNNLHRHIRNLDLKTLVQSRRDHEGEK